MNSYQRAMNQFEWGCKYFALEPEFVTHVLLAKKPTDWAGSFSGGIKGGRAASFFGIAYARILCAQGKHEEEVHYALAAAKIVITDEAAAYRDAWTMAVQGIEHVLQSSDKNNIHVMASRLLEIAKEAIIDLDNRFQYKDHPLQSLSGNLDFIVQHLARAEELLGIPHSSQSEDYIRRKRNAAIRGETGPSKSFRQKYGKAILEYRRKYRVEWFRERFKVKYGREAPIDLFIQNSRYPRLQIKPDLYKLFDTADHREFSEAMEERFRRDNKLPARGEGWISQALLAKYVEQLLPNYIIIREARLPFLGKQRIDIFIPDLNVAIEYQGEQHYYPFEHLNGEEGLHDRQAMDSKKKEACKKKGINLIEWHFSEEITSESVKKRLMAEGIVFT